MKEGGLEIFGVHDFLGGGHSICVATTYATVRVVEESFGFFVR